MLSPRPPLEMLGPEPERLWPQTSPVRCSSHRRLLHRKWWTNRRTPVKSTTWRTFLQEARRRARRAFSMKPESATMSTMPWANTVSADGNMPSSSTRGQGIG